MPNVNIEISKYWIKISKAQELNKQDYGPMYIFRLFASDNNLADYYIQYDCA